MKKIILELRETAHACRETTRLTDPPDMHELSPAEFADFVVNGAKAVSALLEIIVDVTLHHIEAIIDRDQDPRVLEKRDEIIHVIRNVPTLADEVDEDPDSADDLDPILEYLATRRVLLPEIATRLEYIAAYLSTRPSTSITTHNTTITGSSIGAVAVGHRSLARGSSDSKKRRNRN